MLSFPEWSHVIVWWLIIQATGSVCLAHHLAHLPLAPRARLRVQQAGGPAVERVSPVAGCIHRLSAQQHGWGCICILLVFLLSTLIVFREQQVRLLEQACIDLQLFPNP